MAADAKELYENMLKVQPLRFLYTESWWLDAICGADNWKVFVFKDHSGVEIACLPYYSTSVSKLKAAITPPMTQWLGLMALTKNPSIDFNHLLKELSFNAIIDLSIKSENEILYSNSNHPAHLKYSFVIHAASGIDRTRLNYNEGLRRNLKEAEKNYTIRESDDVETLIDLAVSSYHQRKEKAPSWINTVPVKAYKALQSHDRGRITFAMRDNIVIAGIMTGWDSATEYYLLGGRTDSAGASAHALLLDDAISHAISHNRKFDFEGSMHPGIANFFQSFGANPEPYIQVRKYNGLGKIWATLHK